MSRHIVRALVVAALCAFGWGASVNAQFRPTVVQNGYHPQLGELCSIPPGPPAPCQVVRRYARILEVAQNVQVPIVGQGPFGPICAGPFGPGPCDQVRFNIAEIQIAQQTFQLQQIGIDPVFGPICLGPLGPGPCDAVRQYLMRASGSSPTAPLDPRQVQLAPNQGNIGQPMCVTPNGNVPCVFLGQASLDRMGGPVPGVPFGGPASGGQS